MITNPGRGEAPGYRAGWVAGVRWLVSLLNLHGQVTIEGDRIIVKFP